MNYYFPSFKKRYKTSSYDDNFIKSCLVYMYLYEKYISKNLDFDQIIYRLTEAQNNCKSNSVILSNHLIFSLAFRSFWKQYRMGRGCFYVAFTPFQEYEVLGYLTGIVYWCFHGGIASPQNPPAATL